jgi:hypothetical protein
MKCRVCVCVYLKAIRFSLQIHNPTRGKIHMGLFDCKIVDKAVELFTHKSCVESD